MELAPWRSPLARALHRNRSNANSRYPQLATVRSNGRPANRTVVFRDFLEDTNSLQFTSDARSQKLDQLAQNSAAELCWYFTKTREQFRIGGTIDVIDAAVSDESLKQAYQAAWESMSDKARQQFSWPDPGAPRSPDGFEPADLDPRTPLETFVLLIFVPDAVDHLELRGEPQNRCQYWLQPDESWQMKEVNP